MKKYSIVCICQIYNELEKGNLIRFFKHLKPLVDKIIVYDDVSTDGSYEYALKTTDYVFRENKNDFQKECFRRKRLLKKALEFNPDFVLWLDADEVLTAGAKNKLQEICDYCVEKNLDGIEFHELNIWRSRTWQRIDSLYGEGWFTRLWRVKKELCFPSNIKKGLHKKSFFMPLGLEKTERTNLLSVLHYGFSDKRNLAHKYLTYRSHGQKGYIMLDRLISEEKLKLEKIPNENFPSDLKDEEEISPQKIDFIDSLAYVEKYKTEVFRPKYSIVCLIYKSVDWLKFVYEQVLKYTDMKDKEFYFIANDATPEVLEYLDKNYIPHYVLNNTEEQKKEWYINNVYRAYNYGAKMAKGDFILFINSDMAFSSNWFEALVGAYSGNNCVASWLVESGKLESGQHGIEKDFGKNIASYKEDSFQQYANLIKEDVLADGGLFMPLLIKKQHFEMVNGYPEGNIKIKSDIWNPEIAKNGEKLIPGDGILMKKLKQKGITQKTAMGSIVYHFQCGEMDEVKKDEQFLREPNIAICNDFVTGKMGEKVLWNFFLESLPQTFGIDKETVESFSSKKIKKYINEQFPKTQIIIQNATFMDTVDSDKYTIVLLQDDLRSMKKDSAQQERNLKLADKIVTNSFYVASSYRDYDCEIIPIGIDTDLFKPRDKNLMRKKHGFGNEKIGIFVGDFSEVKGWLKVKKCVKKHSDFTWILVSKKKENCNLKNVRIYNQINQQLLSELLNCADFFILGSPVETQCLAALEACFCDIPVVMPKVGIFKQFSEKECKEIGVFTDDLEQGIQEVLRTNFCPSKFVLKRDFTIEDCMKKWKFLLEEVMTEINIKNLKKEKIGSTKLKQNGYWKHLLEFYVRRKIFRKIWGTDYLDLKRKTKSFLYKILLKTNTLKIVKKLFGKR